MPPPDLAADRPVAFLHDYFARLFRQKGRDTLVNRPVDLFLQVTSGCNFDCIMCSEHLRPIESRHGRGLEFLAREHFDQLERELFSTAGAVFLGTGAEPTLNPHLPDYLQRIRSAGVEATLLTNGSRLGHPDWTPVLAQTLNQLRVSVDGATAGTYERIRQGARFDSLLEGFRRFRAANSSGSVDLILCMTMMRSNVHELPLMVDLAASVGARALHAWPVLPVTPEAREELLDESTRAVCEEAFEQARERARRSGVELELQVPHFPAQDSLVEPEMAKPEDADSERAEPVPEAPAREACSMVYRGLFVRWDGSLFPCGHPYVHRGLPIAHLDDGPIQKSWNGPAYRDLRQRQSTGTPPKTCLHCTMTDARWPTSIEAAGSEPEVSDVVRVEPAGSIESVSPGPAEVLELLAGSGLAERIATAQTLEAEDHQRNVEALDLKLKTAALNDRLVEIERRLSKGVFRFLPRI